MCDPSFLLSSSSFSLSRCMHENPVACAALMNIGKALDVSNWRKGKNTNWMDSSSSVCDWQGVTCSDGTKKKTEVIGLDLSHAGVNGYIHSDIGKLTEPVITCRH